MKSLGYILILVLLISACGDSDKKSITDLKSAGTIYAAPDIKYSIKNNLLGDYCLWTDVSYGTYPHKDLFPESAIMTIELSKEDFKDFISDDSLVLWKYIESEIKPHAIVHIVGQKIKDSSLSLYMYTYGGSGLFSMIRNLEVNANTTFENDSKWKQYSYLEQ